MSANNRPSISKRQRELSRQRKKREKAAKRAERRADRPDRDDQAGVDPDIAHIVPGPQPHPFLDEDELGEEATTGDS